MHYIQRYERNRIRYENAIELHECLVSQRESLFQRTQPKGIRIEQERIEGGGDGNPLEEYVVQKEAMQIDKKITESSKLLNRRRRMLARAEKDLRDSKGTWDQIYVYHYLDNRKVSWIAKRMNYSERQVYRTLRKIQDVRICQ